MTQREAVYKATRSVLKDAGIAFEDGNDISNVMTKELRTKIHSIVCEGFRVGNISLKETDSNSEKLNTEAKMSSYVHGLMSNWYRKDKRFNGNMKYVAKNPGSRTGQGDDQLKTLRALYKQFESVKDAGKMQSIQAAIDNRLGQIASQRAKSIKVDLSVLPADLIEELGLNK